MACTAAAPPCLELLTCDALADAFTKVQMPCLAVHGTPSSLLCLISHFAVSHLTCVDASMADRRVILLLLVACALVFVHQASAVPSIRVDNSHSHTEFEKPWYIKLVVIVARQSRVCGH